MLVIGGTTFGITYAAFQKSAEVGKTIYSDGYKKAEIFVNPKWGNAADQTWDYYGQGNPPVYYAYVWNNSDDSVHAWIPANATRNAEHNYIVFHISTVLYDKVLFARIDPNKIANLTTKTPGDNTIWNQTDDLDLTPTTKNLYHITSWHSDGPQGSGHSEGGWDNSLYTRPA